MSVPLPIPKWKIFEEEIAKEFNLNLTKASGALWFSKLDSFGTGSRWSCKFTENNSISISKSIIDEAVNVCQGPGGDNKTPIWALRINESRYDLIVMRKEDFKVLLESPESLSVDVANKKRGNPLPQLLRGN